MGSTRFPGKVLAPFRGRPLIEHVIAAMRTSLPDCPLTVVTSTHPTDDPLANHLAAIGTDCLRGPLEDVFGTWQPDRR